MRIIPVLDLARGVAVHARGGERSRYEPVRSVLTPQACGDPSVLLRAFREKLGVEKCYVADLDAIQGGALQRSRLRELARLQTEPAVSLLVDAGAHQAAGALELLACGVTEVVVGLESLRAFNDLAAIIRLVGPSRLVFSLDLRLGAPVLHPALQRAARGQIDPGTLAARAVDVGVRNVLVLDIGRVGTGSGVDLGLLERLRHRFAAERLLAGGGVVDRRDLERMRDAGCDAALVASAIHSGRIGADDVAALQSETSASR